MPIVLQKMFYRKMAVPIFESLNLTNSDIILLQLKLSILKQIALKRK